MSDKLNDLARIEGIIIPEFIERFRGWNAEYPQERPLGVKAEWHGLHRKVMKLKGPIWDGTDASAWREDPRTIFLEIMGHAALAIASLDEEALRAVQQEPDDSVDGDIRYCSRFDACPDHGGDPDRGQYTWTHNAPPTR